MKVQCMDLPMSTSQGLSTTLGWSGSPKPSNSSERVETNFPVGLQLQDQNLGLWIGCFGAGSPPSPDALSVSSPEVGKPTETGAENLMLSQGMESHSPHLPEPSSGQSGTQSILSPSPQPTTHPASPLDCARRRVARRGSQRSPGRRMRTNGTQE